MTGGDKLEAYLKNIASNLAATEGNPSVSIGFLEDAFYPDGQSVAYIASIQEFGATIQREPQEAATIYRKIDKNGNFLRDGKFVKKRESNFASSHYVGAYTITIPPRPFFRNMIKANAPTWGDAIAKLLKSTDYKARKTLNSMGALIKGQLQQSINDLTSPANAKSTIAKKGASKPLIDTGYMWNSVDYRVDNV